MSKSDLTLRFVRSNGYELRRMLRAAPNLLRRSVVRHFHSPRLRVGLLLQASAMPILRIMRANRPKV